MKRFKDWYAAVSDMTKLFLCICIFFGGVAWIAYQDSIIRLDHFASLASILGSLATAATLIWLVIERDQLQKEKLQTEKRKQAANTSAWLSYKTFGSKIHYKKQIIIFNNSSESPIYNVVASIVDARNKDAKGKETPEEFRQVIATCPPGQAYCFAPEGYNGVGFHPGVEIAFSDTDGSHWIRRGDGLLENLDEEPFVHYRIPQPPVYEVLHEL